MVTIFKAIDNARDREELLRILVEFFDAHGFNAVCFIQPSQISPGSLELFQHGFDAEWISKYQEHRLDLLDPVPSFAMQSGSAFNWQHTYKLKKVNDVEASFLRELSESKMTGGLALPTYGRLLRAGYVGIGMVDGPDILEGADVPFLHAVAQHAHARFEREQLTDAGRPRLSPRENEIMKLVSAGKTNHEIAVILGNSTATIATHLKRIFDKLDVSDRAAAVAAAMRLHLLY